MMTMRNGEEIKRYRAVKVATKNDRNGNPRRGWIVTDGMGAGYSFVDEGYLGYGALKRSHGDDVMEVCGPIEITPAEYRRLKKYEYKAISAK